MKKDLNNIDQEVLSIAKNHYENFPVTSLLIPKDFRKDIAIVYWFARTADDLADEGNIDSEIRIKKLNEFEENFINSLSGFGSNEYFETLVKTIKQRNITETHFLDLLSAFKQDVIKKRYENFDDVLHYCKRSANPIGRILLEIFNIDLEEAKIYSDKICTALQLTNFLQDTLVDFEKGRIYLPQNELKTFLVTEKMFEIKQNNPNIKALVKENVDRTQGLFDEGKNLLTFLSGRFKTEIKWTIAGGERILSKIRKNDFDVLNVRPKLTKIDFILLFIKSII